MLSLIRARTIALESSAIGSRRNTGDAALRRRPSGTSWTMPSPAAGGDNTSLETSVSQTLSPVLASNAITLPPRLPINTRPASAVGPADNCALTVVFQRFLPFVLLVAVTVPSLEAVKILSVVTAGTNLR